MLAEILTAAALHPLAQKACEGTKVDPHLLVALAVVESVGNSKALGQAGEVGLCQISQAAFDDVRRIYTDQVAGLWDLLNPATNLRVAALYLDHLLGRFVGERWALYAYNAGPTEVAEWRYWGVDDDDLPEVVCDYAARVLALMDKYQAREREENNSQPMQSEGATP